MPRDGPPAGREQDALLRHDDAVLGDLVLRLHDHGLLAPHLLLTAARAELLALAIGVVVDPDGEAPEREDGERGFHAESHRGLNGRDVQRG